MGKIDFFQIHEIIKQNNTFSIYIHINTDFDAVGSALGLRKILMKLGKTAHIFVDSILPPNVSILEDYECINNEKLDRYDVCCVLDCNEENRIGRLKYKYRKNVKTSFQIDHHLANTNFLRVNAVDDTASSTCELIYDLANYLKIEFDKSLCKSLACGILTDTGCLKFSNVKPSTLRAMADLLEKGQYIMDEITYPLFNNLSFEAFNLKKRSLDNLEIVCDKKVGIVVLTEKDLSECGVGFEHTKGLTDLPMQIENIKVVVLATENKMDNAYHISIRTKDSYSAQAIAKEFGGGGHMKAAGCKIPIEYERSLKQMIIDAVKKELNK